MTISGNALTPITDDAFYLKVTTTTVNATEVPYEILADNPDSLKFKVLFSSTITTDTAYYIYYMSSSSTYTTSFTQTPVIRLDGSSSIVYSSSTVLTFTK